MNRRHRRWVLILGPATALSMASATSAVRGEVGSTNVGIALAAVVATAALVGRVVGLTTALVAALSFNFFHTEPYHTFRVNSAGDAAIVALLALLGFVVGDLNAWGRQRRAQAHLNELGDASLEHVRGLLDHDRPVLQVWHGVVDACVGGLAEADCRFVPGPSMPGLAVIARPARERSASETRVVVPAVGAALPVRCDGAIVGHLVVVPPRDLAPLSLDRRVLATLSDQVALVVRPVRERDGRWSLRAERGERMNR